MRLIFDADAAIYSLHVPRDPKLIAQHRKARKIFSSFAAGVNELFLPSTVVVEVAGGLSRLLSPDVAQAGINMLLGISEEIYPMTLNLVDSLLYAFSVSAYFRKCLDNASNWSRVPKAPEDADVPGFICKYTEVRIGGMDIFVLTYAELKNVALLTNDWSLWYIAWKKGLVSYWLSGLSEQQAEDLAQGKAVVYPTQG